MLCFPKTKTKKKKKMERKQRLRKLEEHMSVKFTLLSLSKTSTFIKAHEI